jgi:uncharacterized membrane protein
VTILVLQLASSQFSPRVLRTFLEDRFTRVALGVFIGSFVYAIVLLPEVRESADDQSQFVPSLSVYVALLLALVSVLVFVRYIHEMAHAIRAVEIVRRVAAETRSAIVRMYPDPIGEEPEDKAPDAPAGEAQIVTHDARGGVLAEVDEDELLAAVVHHDACAELLHEPGGFVPQGAPLYRVWNARDFERLEHALREHTVIAPERTPEQDPAFGFRQLVDIGERALSPSMNDPTTAVQVLDQLHDLLRTLATRRFPSSARLDEHGKLRLLLPRPGYAQYVELAFEEIRDNARGSVQVLRRMRSALGDLLTVVSEPRRSPLVRQLAALERAERG